MKYMVKPVVAAFLLSMAGSALAVQKDITVTANIDSALDMTRVDGSALPNSVEMQYIPGTGLSPVSIMSKIWSNAPTGGAVQMRLVSSAQLVNTTGANADGTAITVPLSVSWGTLALTTTNQALAVTDIFPNGTDALTTGSVARELTISQTTKGALTTGSYQGVVSIYLSQSAATGG